MMKKVSFSTIWNWVFLTILGLLLICVGWIHLFQIEDLPKSEMRPLAVKPRVSLDASLLNLPSKFEAYFVDRFPLRYWSIRLSHTVQFHLAGNHFFPDVLVGDAGWLFLNQPDYVDVCQHSNLRNAAHSNQVAEKLSASQKLLNEQGVEFFVVVIPEKCTIYPEYSQHYLPILEQESVRETLVTYLQANTSIPSLDLTVPLRQAKENHQLYLQRDTHWNAIGAYAAYGEIVQLLLPDLGPDSLVPWGDGSSTQEDVFHTDLGLFVNLAAFPNTEIMSVPSGNDLQAEMTLVENGALYENPSAENKQTLLVLHDSFFQIAPIKPFLAEHFEKAVFLNVNEGIVWKNDPAFISGLIEKWSPDFLVVVYAERNLPWLGN